MCIVNWVYRKFVARTGTLVAMGNEEVMPMCCNCMKKKLWVQWLGSKRAKSACMSDRWIIARAIQSVTRYPPPNYDEWLVPVAMHRAACTLLSLSIRCHYLAGLSWPIPRVWHWPIRSLIHSESALALGFRIRWSAGRPIAEVLRSSIREISKKNVADDF